MSEPFIGQVTMFAGDFAPRSWALCDGQLLPISSNSALFSILGTIYGGDGRTTFALPDLRGRAPIHAGTGPGLSSMKEGSKSGTETVTLTSKNLPPISAKPTEESKITATSTATVNASKSPGTSLNPKDKVWAVDSDLDSNDKYYSAYDSSQGATMATEAVTVETTIDLSNLTLSAKGSSTPFSIRSPYLVLNFIIALQGVYPSR